MLIPWFQEMTADFFIFFEIARNPSGNAYTWTKSIPTVGRWNWSPIETGFWFAKRG